MHETELRLRMTELIWYYLKIYTFVYRMIDHGDGLLALRITNPIYTDSSIYTCVIASEYGCCTTSCEVNIRAAHDMIREPIPTFIIETEPAVAMVGSNVSFCSKFAPISARSKWFVCGREINENTRGTIVSLH